MVKRNDLLLKLSQMATELVYIIKKEGGGIMKKKFAVTVATLVLCLAFCVTGVVAQLGVSTAAATTIINIIDAGSTIMTIVSILGVVVGAGAISYAFVVAAKAMIKKVGKKLAITW